MQSTLTASAQPRTIERPGFLSDLRWLASDSFTIIRRNLTQIRRVPEKLLDVTIQPIMFVVLFGFVFGGAINVPDGIDYRSFLMAGIFTQSIAFLAVGTAVGMTEDMKTGVMDRFRSLPISRAAVLFGRTFSDLIQSALGATVLGVTGAVVGWRIHESFISAVAGFGVLLLFGFAMSWIGILLGLVVRTSEGAQGVGFMAIFPLTFASNAFVPTDSMPKYLRIFAEWNPISATTAALRSLFGNSGPALQSGAWPMENPVAASLLWSVALLVIFVPLAIWKYRQTVNR